MGKKTAAALLSGLVLLTCHPAIALDRKAAGTVVANAVDRFIRPAYADFDKQAAGFLKATQDFCSKPSETALTQLQGGFGDLVRSWARIEIVREGPVLQENRFERILFFPDRKSMGMKQVQAIIASPDETATDPAKLKGKSVAVQGLGALELVLYGTGSPRLLDEAGKADCRYAKAIAGNVAEIAGELDKDWSAPGGTGDLWKTPGPDNPVFRNESEAIQTLIGIHVHGLETVRDQRIKLFYGGKGARTAEKAAIFWRSGNTMPVLAVNVQGLEELWQKSDMALLLGADSASFANSVAFDYKTARGALAKLEQPTRERLGDPKYVAKLDFVEFNLRDAIERIDKDVAGTIGLGAGFSFGDGD